ncbi:hydrogenase membrane subunit [Candidatus Woesearchaeota archaeon]|nr:hydrogenase membrane subunit [Candidatus Woesearchaeota archaeon]
MITAYVTIGILTPLLMLLSRTHKTTSLMLVAHTLIHLGMTGILVINITEPVYYLANNYFFIDALSTFEVLITSIIFFFAALYARGYVDGLLTERELSIKNVKVFYLGLTTLLTGLTLAFFSNNLALFWIWAEVTTILSAVLLVTLNAKENITAALQYVFVTSTAMLFSFIGLIMLFAVSKQALGAGTLNWDVLMLHASEFSPALLGVTFAFTFIGFAAKAGIFPFHTWLPEAHAKAPSVVSVILSTSVTSVGLYGIIRMYALVHPYTQLGAEMATVFGLLSMGVACFSMLQQKNLKMLIAFSTVENLGFMLFAIPVSLFWVLFHSLAHALAKALLFFSAGIIRRHYHSTELSKMKNILQQPFAAWGLIMGGAAAMGMPPFGIFLSKWFILTNVRPAMLSVLLFFMLTAAAAFAVALTGTLSPDEEKKEKYRPSRGMVLSLAGVLFLLLLFGVMVPEDILALLTATVEGLA